MILVLDIGSGQPIEHPGQPEESGPAVGVCAGERELTVAAQLEPHRFESGDHDQTAQAVIRQQLLDRIYH